MECEDLETDDFKRILFLVDQETFASLILTSRLWHYAAETPQLYAYHLSRCPSFSATFDISNGPFGSNSLQGLKRQFIQEAKKNLFSVFARPTKTVINLISTTTSSAGAFPFGEAFEFSFSAGGLWCLAKSSSRLIIIDIASDEPSIKRELKVVRKPLAAYILQDGKKLAVLSSSHKVNIYYLEGTPKLLRTVALDEDAHALALSPHGEVLAVAYNGGVEVTSLLDQALPSDKRAVKCDRVDALSFSADGTILLGTTQSSKSASTVIISAPYFTGTGEDIPLSEMISHMWTSQILFPYSSRDCSHAALLPRKLDQDSSWTLAYDRVFESFRAVRTDDLRNGHTYFAGPKRRTRSERQHSKSALTPCTLPAITENGELVAAGFLGSEIWLYGVPEELNNHSDTSESSPQNTQLAEASSSLDVNTIQSGIDQLPRWQVLVDKYRNVFAKGHHIATVSNLSQMCWVSRPKCEKGLLNIRERLVVGAPGGVSIGYELEQEEMASVDGGRLVLLDFSWCSNGGYTKEITIEVGLTAPEKLEEQDTDMATEIAIVRRRTVARRDGIPRSQVASVADVLRPADEPVPPVPALLNSVGFGFHTASGSTPSPEQPGTPVSPTNALTLQEAANAFDGPYSHSNPRSRNTLYRSATAVEASRRRTPLALPSTAIVEYRRNDGTELPHESDADNWVPPPPPYTRNADLPLPHHLRQTLLPRPNRTLSSAFSASFRRPLRSLAAVEHMNFRRRSSADVDLISHSYGSRRSIAAISLDPIERDNIIGPVAQRHSESPTSPVAVTPLASFRRPVSTYETRPDRSSLYRAALRPAEPITLVAESVSELPISLPIISAPRSRTFRSSSLTLSGPNLQQRLDYALPPAPSPKSTASPIETPSPARSSPRRIYGQPDIPRSTALASAASPSASIPLPPKLSVTIPKSVATQQTTQQQQPVIVTSPLQEPSAYTSNSTHFVSQIPLPLPIPDIVGNRRSRFRSPFRRNTERAVSQPHFSSVSAMNFSSNTLGGRSSSRLNTVYNLNSDNANPLVSMDTMRTNNPPMRRPNTHYDSPEVPNHSYSSRAVRQTAKARPPSRFGARLTFFRGRGEDPLVSSLAPQRGAVEAQTTHGHVARGRLRVRRAADSEPHENAFPRERAPLQNEIKKRKGGGRCIVM